MRAIRFAMGCLALASICLPAAAADEFTNLLPAGTELTGWVVEGTKDYPEGSESRPNWTLEDGIVRCAGKGFGFLRYDRELGDFVFKAEYRMSKGCNSGIGIRGTKFTGPANTRPSFAGYEIQILDDGGKQPEKGSSMSLYRYVAPKSTPAKPAGEWNQVEIACRGPHIKITLNGEVVQDVDQSQIDEIKGKPLRGYLSLQNHGKVVEFRNLQLQTAETK